MAIVLRDWFTGNSNLEKDLNLMRNKAGLLFAMAADIATQVRNEELNPGKNRKMQVHYWMENAQNIKSIIEGIEHQVTQGSNPKEIRNQIHMIIKEMDELIGLSDFQNGLTLDDLSSVALVTTEMKGQQFEKNLRKIVSWLSGDEVQNVGVYGLGGVGKTTLLMHIHNQLLPGKCSVYWMTVSQNCTISMLQEKIGKELNLKDVLADADTMKRPAILSEALKKRSNVVVILDDVWDCFPVEKVGIPVGKYGCKLLLSTRSLDVCRRMRCQRSVKLETLTEEESWSLFAQGFGDVDDLSVEAKNVAKLVVKECGGLPLGIKVVAATMCGVLDVHEWCNTLEELKSSTRNHVAMEKEVFPSLQLSYNRLKNVKLQDCFLSCVLYPEDHYVRRKDLVNLWIMEGHLEEIPGWQERLNMAHTILNRLISASLLEQTRDFVKMHDLVRDMAIKISRERHHSMIKSGMQLTEVPCLQEWTEEMSKASLMFNNIGEIPSGMSPRCPLLSTLLLRDNPLNSIPDSFFQFFKGLKVLDLSETEIEVVPDCISHMENLLVLNVSHCERLDYIPSLVKLTKLRQLDMTECPEIGALPEGMEKLANLECLRIAGCGTFNVTFCELTSGLSNIKCLELDCSVGCGQMGDVQKLECLEILIDLYIHEMRNFNAFVDSYHLHNLTSYQLFLGPEIDMFEDHCSLYNRTIMIGCSKFEDEAEAQSVQLPNNLQELQVAGCEFHVRSLADALPSLKCSTWLARISVSCCEGLESIWSDSSSGNPTLENLEELDISFTKSFRALASGRVELASGTLSSLKRLKVKNCSAAERLFTSCLLKGTFRNLEEIEIKMCKQLQEIFAGSDMVDEDESEDAIVVEVNQDMIIELPKLRVLTLINLKRLVSICNVGLDYCKSIEIITVTRCPQLKKLPLLLQVLENGMLVAPPRLQSVHVEREWWESLSWDDSHIKYTLQPFVQFCEGSSCNCCRTFDLD